MPIGAAPISDNGPGDSNPLPGVIDFQTMIPPSGQALFDCRGRVELSNQAQHVSLGPNPSILRLTSFECRRLSAGSATTSIRFEHVVTNGPLPGPQVFFADGIVGLVRDRMLGAASIAPGVDIQFQGYAAGAGFTPRAIGPLSDVGVNAPFRFRMTFGTNGLPIPFGGGHGRMTPVGESPWTLRGDMSIALAGVDDIFSLPTSAEVGVGEVPETLPIPTVSEWGLIVMGLLMLTIAKLQSHAVRA